MHEEIGRVISELSMVMLGGDTKLREVEDILKSYINSIEESMKHLSDLKKKHQSVQIKIKEMSQPDDPKPSPFGISESDSSSKKEQAIWLLEKTNAAISVIEIDKLISQFEDVLIELSGIIKRHEVRSRK